MKQKTETKIILYFTLIYSIFLIWDFAIAEFKDWTVDIKPGLSVVEAKQGLDGVLLPKMIYDSEKRTEEQDGANNKQSGDLNTEEIKEVAGTVEAFPEDDQPRWEIETKSLSPSEEQIKKEIERVFGDKAEEAKLICGCESRYQVDIWGDTTTAYKSVGLFQIRELPKRMEMYGLTTEMLEDYKTNIHMAKIIYDKAGGWGPWFNCKNKYNL